MEGTPPINTPQMVTGHHGVFDQDIPHFQRSP